jgi:hypothetical protein
MPVAPFRKFPQKRYERFTRTNVSFSVGAPLVSSRPLKAI